MVSLPIEERLLHYFIAMGAQRADPFPKAPPGLTLTLGSDKVHVAILNNDAILQRGKILESVLDLASMKDSMNQLYLAAPRLFGTTIDAEVFRSHGIGLLLFDDRRIDETVEPQSVHRPQTEQCADRIGPSIVTEVETLRSMYLEMEKTVSKLREDLKIVQENFNYPPSAPEEISQPRIFHQEARFAESLELPSFFSNNPWLDVLSRRGREENIPIAG